MNAIDSTLGRWAPRALGLLRIISGFLLMAHGSQKLFAFPAAPSFGQPPLVSLLGLAAVLELGGGLLLLIGLFTRSVAFVLSGFTAVAYFMAHAPAGVLADREQRRAGGAVLLRVPLHGRRRWRRLERGSRAAIVTVVGRVQACQMALAIVLMLSASTAMLKTNASTLCTSVSRRMIGEITWTSETCDVMPTTNE